MNNTEEIKLLIPDYITGNISDSNRSIVTQALNESEELREVHSELKSSFDVVGSYKFKEPTQQYFINLLPRIHQRIEEREEKLAVKNPFAIWWKILVPVAAIILIVIIYKLATNDPGTQLTKEDKKENIKQVEKIDSVVKQNEQKQNIEDRKEFTNENKKLDKVKRLKVYKDNDTLKDDFPNNKDNDNKKADMIPDSEEFASNDIKEISLFGTGEAGGIDEELMDEIEKLNVNEQDDLLKQLELSNL